MVVAAVYRVGQAEAGTIFVVRGAALAAAEAAQKLSGSEVLDETTLVVGPPELRAAARALHARRGEAAAGDAELLRLRDAAMPAKASGAALRLTVRLSKDARINAAGRLALDEFPAALSVWMDVADDVGMVALLTADDAAQAKRFAAATLEARARLVPLMPRWLGGAALCGAFTRRQRIGRPAWSGCSARARS